MSIRANKLTSLLFFKSIVSSNFKRLSFPLKISYVVTYRCNLKCKMCNIWKKPDIQDELTIKEVENFFKRANRFSWIGFTGGEVFLRPDLQELMDVLLFYSKRLDAVHFATNGQLTDEAVALTQHMRKRKKGLKVLYTVSIDGPPLLHDEIRGRRGAWDKAVHTFRSLKETEGVKAQIGFTLSEYNMGKFPDTFMALKSRYPQLKFDDMTVNIFQRSSIYYNNQDMRILDRDKTAKAIRDILEMDKERLSVNNFLRRKYLKLHLEYLNTDKCPLKCQALSSSCFLDPYGNLFPCTIYNKKLLNIRDLRQDFIDVWNSDHAKRLSYECSNNICPSCWSPCDAYSTIGGSLIKACLSNS